MDTHLRLEESEYFCYIPINTNDEAITGLCVLLFALLFIFLGIYKYIKISKFNMSRHVKQIYIFIFLWGAFYITKMVYAQILFLIGKEQDPQDLSIQSKYYLMLDVFTVYVLQAALINLPINWMQNIVAIISQLSSLENDGGQQTANSTNFQVKTVKLLKMYQFVRLIIIVPFIPFFIAKTAHWQQILSLIIIGMLFCEMIFVLAILALGFKSLYSNNRLAELIEQADLKLLGNQYKILIICTLIRFGIDTIFVYLNWENLGPSDKCIIKVDSNSLRTILYLLGESFLTHFLPIFIIYRIYSVSDQDFNPSDSLLAVEPYKSEDSKSRISDQRE